MKCAVVIEKARNNFSAYVPDLPGCVATGASVEEAEAEIGKAIALHIEGLLDDGLPVPEPKSILVYVEA
jgi:predicted RNase H-like HicB family nuclease